MEVTDYCCEKCRATEFKISLYQPAGALFDSVFGKANKKVIGICCEKCGNVEVFKTATETVCDIVSSIGTSKSNSPLKYIK